MKLALITNPRSRRNRRDPALAARLGDQLGTLGTSFAPEGLDALDEVARSVREADARVVSISGGDGSNHAVLSALARAYGDHPLPAIHLLRAGTMNTTARNLGLSGAPQARLARLVQQLERGVAPRTVDRSVLVVDGQRVGVLFGMGVIYGFLAHYYKGSEPSPLKAFRLLMQMAASAGVQGSLIREVFEPANVRVLMGDKEWPETQFSAVTAGTMPDLGLGFRPFGRVLEHPGHMQLLGFVGAPWTIAAALPRIRLAAPIDRPDVHDVLTTAVRFESDAPIPYMVDGDLYTGTTSVTLEVGPTVRFVVD